MACRGRECVVIVVPAFAHRQHSKHEVVPAMILVRIRLLSPQMAHGVHTPGNMVNKKQTHQATPDKTKEDSHPAPGHNPTHGCWNCQTQDDPEGKESIHHTH